MSTVLRISTHMSTDVAKHKLHHHECPIAPCPAKLPPTVYGICLGTATQRLGYPSKVAFRNFYGASRREENDAFGSALMLNRYGSRCRNASVSDGGGPPLVMIGYTSDTVQFFCLFFHCPAVVVRTRGPADAHSRGRARRGGAILGRWASSKLCKKTPIYKYDELLLRSSSLR